MPENSIKIVTWNVNGIRACYKKNLVDFIKAHKPNILCLQETKAHIDQVERDIQTLGFKNSFWSSAEKKGYSGVATFLDDTISPPQKGWGQNEYDREGRILISDHKDFLLYNIYFPNGGSGEERHFFKQKFLKDLNQHLKETLKLGKEIIVLGDYNVAHTEQDVYDPIRLAKESGFLPEERAWFDSFLELGFVDAFRHFYPTEKERYSWWSYREFARVSNRGWRIDYICLSKGLLGKLKSCAILDEVDGSDHCPVVIELSIN